VGAAFALAKDGDVIAIPAGTASWDTTLTVSKAITIQGAGIGQTIIKDALPGPSNLNSSCFDMNTEAGKFYRITGIEFQDGGTAGKTKGVLSVRGISHSIRIDHCKFTITHNRPIAVYDWALGVTDHCEFHVTDGAIHVFHSTWGNGTEGDRSWSSPSTLGTADAWYLEDSTVQSINPADNVGILDAEGGARWVVRYCHLINAHQASHGTEGGLDRSTRQFEIYGNTFQNTTSRYANAIHNRGGSGVIWGNTVTGAFGKFATLNYYREFKTYTFWGTANGRNPVDHNVSAKLVDGIDMPGAGRDAGLNRSNPAYPSQIIEGIYEWNNTINGGNAQLDAEKYQFITAGRHFFNDTPKPGYAPYAYPHPLTGGSSPSPTPTPTATPTPAPTPTPTATPVATPNPPTNLRVVPGP
jgi:hypothetical protein